MLQLLCHNTVSAAKPKVAVIFPHGHRAEHITAAWLAREVTRHGVGVDVQLMKLLLLVERHYPNYKSLLWVSANNLQHHKSVLGFHKPCVPSGGTRRLLLLTLITENRRNQGT